jgi:transposase-like protein
MKTPALPPEKRKPPRRCPRCKSQQLEIQGNLEGFEYDYRCLECGSSFRLAYRRP